MYKLLGIGAVSQENIAPLIGQQVTVNLAGGQAYGPASFTSFGRNSRGVTAVFRDALGNVREFNIADISSVVQTARTVVVEQPVYVEPWPSYAPTFYGGGWGGGGHHGGHHHGHHHGIDAYAVNQPAILPVPGGTTLSASTGTVLAAAIPIAIVTLGILGAAWFFGR